MKIIEKIKGLFVWVLIMSAMVFGIWTAGKYYADSVSDYVVIQPDPGIRCVVVSRMFNTSVACWEYKKYGYIPD